MGIGRKPLVVWVAALALIPLTSPRANAPDGQPDPMSQQAATYAIRAIASAGLLDPLGQYYSYKSVVSLEDRWVVSFASSTCYRDEHIETCDPNTDTDGDGYGETDAWLEIAIDQGDFFVTSAFGRFSDEDRSRLAAYREPAVVEPAHLEWPTVRLDVEEGERFLRLRAANLWAGFIDDDVVWAVCRTIGYDDQGNVVYEDERALAHRARGEDSRSGGLFGSGVPSDRGITRAEIPCENWEENRETWYVARADVSWTKKDPRHVLVSAELRWFHGLISGLESDCEITLFKRRGRTRLVKRGPLSPWANGRGTQQRDIWRLRVRYPSRVTGVDVTCGAAGTFD